MSLIETLSIQGIRSFEPSRPQKLDFIRPVTLIVGTNGAGKTTIIECLKYATTGELPPGAKTNGSFVHDPKLTGEATIRAKVGIKMIDVFKQPMMVTRSLEATQKQNQRSVTVRTMDATIKRVLPNGQVQSLNQKCTSIDSELAISLGVSKPVLEYVIFCHQEESNWPLMEGKLVKQRFDEIFASARYVKALEEVRGLKKIYDQQVKSTDAELAHLRQVKEEADAKSRDLAEKKVRLSAYEEEKRKVTERLEPLEAALAKYEEQLEQVNRLQAQLDSGREQRSSLARDIEEQRSGIDSLFEGDDEALETRLASVAKEDAELDSRLAKLRRDLDSARASESALEAQAQALAVELGRLQQERDRAEAVGREAQALASRLADKLADEAATEQSGDGEDAEAEFDEPDGLSAGDKGSVDAVLRRLDAHTRRLDARRRRLEEVAAGVLADVERRLAVANDDRSRAKQRIEFAMAQAAQSTSRAKTLRSEAAEAERAAGRLGNLRARLTKAEAELAEAETGTDADGDRRRLAEAQSLIDSHQSELDSLDSRIEAAVRGAAARAETAAVRKELAAKTAQLERLRNRHGDELAELLGSPVPQLSSSAATQLKRRFLDLQSTAERESRSAETALAERRCDRGRIETELSHLREQKRRLDADRRSLEERLINACGGGDAESAATAVAEAEERRAKAEDEKALLQGELHVYRAFLEKVRSKPAAQAACALCDRRFAGSAEVRDHIDRLERLAERLPSRLRDAEAAAAEAATRCEELLLMRPVVERLAELSNVEAPKLSEKLSATESRLAESRRAIAELEKLAVERRQISARCQALESDVRAMESLALEADGLAERCRVSDNGDDQGDGEGDGLAALQDSRRKVKAAYDAASAEARSARQAAEQRAERRQSALESVNKLRSERLTAEEKLRDAARLTQEASRLEAESTEASSRAEADGRTVVPRLEAAVAELEAERDQLRRQQRHEAAAASAAWEAAATDRSRLEALRREAASAGADGEAVRRLERQTRRQAGLAASREAAAAQAARLAELLDSERRAKYARDAERKDLEACRRVRQLEARLSCLDAELTAQTAQLAALNIGADARQRYPRMRREEEALREERSRLETRRCELNGQVRELEKDLDKELFRSAGEKYQKKLTESRIKDMCSQDLATYYKALDWAICQYHTEKMTEVNKLIRDLWRATYRGSDIDYIEIRSDEDTSGVTKSRRQYNYRVVMCKSGAEMDMRGRCSAGQKVLCSLIVRLALAEAFCHNCGILALDEPTTNLDRENIESLANSLSEIIRTRATQQLNFHMIVITHDEEFVELLGRSEFVDHFFRVQSDPAGSGHSEIHRRKVEELHPR
ncbi:hypothetical protein BOX15_Mlig019249g1 [Macrostomum lignano]|uniref:Rad50/SbcC-type AAA domain-containing protein n=3 Tax=Macrostomum lignano TaxID=282301 RepID=A0A267EFQ4_9PLAT|nr:hypothetical protein BOX15_Mlig019249g1 [Macrostomum lignano]